MTADFNTSESVLTAALATHALRRFGEAMRLADDEQTAATAAAAAAKQRDAIMRFAWNGDWLRRSYFGEASGWLGDRGAGAKHAAGPFSAQHGWAMLGGVFDGYEGMPLICP